MKNLKNKTVLVCGGTGSFGNAFVEKYLNSGISEFRIFSRDEKKQHDMRLRYNSEKIKFYIGDVRDQLSLDKVTEGVDFVFQAAALKQVPSCEFFPLEAVKTNILGTQNLINSCFKNSIKSLVCLSTDKAAYPINAMGMSKALMEKIAISNSRNNDSKTKICVTRYGNVMASRGSVIPLFVDQIKNKKPLTITDPDMTRFLMSLDEAVDLVMFAFNNGDNGDLFVQKSPACTIGILAKALLKIFDSNSKIEIIGIRHGEKNYETLCTREEMAKSINLDKFYKVPYDDRDLNYSKFFSKGYDKIKNSNEYNSNNTERLNLEQVIEKLLSIEYIKKELNK